MTTDADDPYGDKKKRPKDMSLSELCQLPVGPYVDEEVPWTEADYASGAAVGRCRVKIILRPMMVTWFGPDDWTGWRDPTGHGWTFGQFTDGSWFKRRAPEFDQ